jgi:hypothetical protein
LREEVRGRLERDSDEEKSFHILSRTNYGASIESYTLPVLQQPKFATARATT